MLTAQILLLKNLKIVNKCETTYLDVCWLRSTVGRTSVLIGELSLSVLRWHYS